MKKISWLILFANACSLVLSACQPSGAGPRTWIDQPLDKSTYPNLQPILLQAHSSDGDGVASIEFYLEDETLIMGQAGGDRMGKIIYEWMPRGEGEYTIFARATDNSGNTGMPTSTTIYIGDLYAQIELPEPEIPEVEPEPQEEEEEEEAIQVAEEPPSGPTVTSSQAINCREGADTAFPVSAVLKKDDPAAVIGRLSNNTWYRITHPQSLEKCWVSAAIVSKRGDFSSVPVAQSPPPPESPPAEPEPEPEPVDETAPTIASVQVSPGTIYQSGCSGFTQSATISLQAIDISGIATVEAVWSIGSEGGTVSLSHTGGNTYQGTIGPVSTSGTVTIHGSAIDPYGNWTPFITSVVVKCCVC